MLTSVNLMLFSLLQNLCSTTRYTISRESDSLRWTAPAAGVLVAVGFGVIFWDCSSLALDGWLAATWAFLVHP